MRTAIAGMVCWAANHTLPIQLWKSPAPWYRRCLLDTSLVRLLRGMELCCSGRMPALQIGRNVDPRTLRNNSRDLSC